MDRSKKGPPEVPHREGALGDLWGIDFEGVLGRELFFLGGSGGPAGEWRGGWRGTSEAHFWRGAVFWRIGWPGLFSRKWGFGALSGVGGIPSRKF